MAKVSYSFYLLRVISKKWGLYAASLISFVVIILIYQSSIKEMNNTYKSNIINITSKSENTIISGLISSNISLIITYLSLVPFIVYLVWIVFKDKNDSSELIILTKDASRLSIILQKFFVSIMIIIINATIMIPAYFIVASKDVIMSSSESSKWAWSMFVGTIIVSIATLSIVIMLSMFLKLIPLFFLTMAISTVVPISSSIMLEKNNETPWVEVVLAKGENNLYSFYNDHNGSLRHSAIHIGTNSPIADSEYEKNFHKYDSWTGIQHLFSLFSSENNKNMPRGSWSEEVKMSNIVDFNDSNSIQIGQKRFMPEFFKPNNRPIYERPYRVDEFGNHIDIKQSNHYSMFIQLLSNDNLIASSFKNQPLVYQLALMYEMYTSTDITNNTKTIYNNSLTNLTPEKYFTRKYIIWPSIYADLVQLENANKSTLIPSSVEPSNANWALWEDITHEVGDKERGLNFISDQDLIYKNHINEEFGVSKTIKVMWAIIFSLLLPLTLAIYIRKDFK